MTARCESCQAEIIFAWTRNRKPMPLDKPGLLIPTFEDADGNLHDARNVAAYKDVTGRLIARVLKRDEEPLGFERRYMPHFATCTRPAAHRKRDKGRTAVQPGQRRKNPAPTPTLY